jgi:hypothetical protein
MSKGKSIGKMVFLSCISKPLPLHLQKSMASYKGSDIMSIGGSTSGIGCPAREAQIQMDRTKRRHEAKMKLTALQHDFYASLVRQQAEQGGIDAISVANTMRSANASAGICSSAADATPAIASQPMPSMCGSSVLVGVGGTTAASISNGGSSHLFNANGRGNCQPTQTHTDSNYTVTAASAARALQASNNMQELYNNHCTAVSASNANATTSVTSIAAAIAVANTAATAMNPTEWTGNGHSGPLSPSVPTFVPSHVPYAYYQHGINQDQKNNNVMQNLNKEEDNMVPLEDNRLLKSPNLSPYDNGGIMSSLEHILPDLLLGFESSLPSAYGGFGGVNMNDGHCDGGISSSDNMKFTSSFDEMHQFLGHGFPTNSDQDAFTVNLNEDPHSHSPKVSLKRHAYASDSKSRNDDMQRGPATVALQEQLERLKAVYDMKVPAVAANKKDENMDNQEKNSCSSPPREQQGISVAVSDQTNSPPESDSYGVFAQLSMQAVSNHSAYTHAHPASSSNNPFGNFYYPAPDSYQQGQPQAQSQVLHQDGRGEGQHQQATAYNYGVSINQDDDKRKVEEKVQVNKSNSAQNAKVASVGSGSERTSSEGGGGGATYDVTSCRLSSSRGDASASLSYGSISNSNTNSCDEYEESSLTTTMSQSTTTGRGRSSSLTHGATRRKRKASASTPVLSGNIVSSSTSTSSSSPEISSKRNKRTSTNINCSKSAVSQSKLFPTEATTTTHTRFSDC